MVWKYRMIKNNSFVNVEFDNNKDHSGEAKRSRVDVKLGLEDIKTFYTFRAWARENLSIYEEGLGTYENADDELIDKHAIIFLNYIKNNFSDFDNGIIEREDWMRLLSSSIRYGNKLLKVNKDKK